MHLRMSLLCLNIHVCSSSSNDGLSFNYDAMPCVELNNIENRIDCLSSTLNDCVHENEKIVRMCDKKNSFKNSHIIPSCMQKFLSAQFMAERVTMPNFVLMLLHN